MANRTPLIVAATARAWRITGPDGCVAAGRVDHGDKADQLEAASQVMDQLEAVAPRIRHASMTELHRSRLPSKSSEPFRIEERPRGAKPHVLIQRSTGNPVEWFRTRRDAILELERLDPTPPPPMEPARAYYRGVGVDVTQVASDGQALIRFRAGPNAQSSRWVRLADIEQAGEDLQALIDLEALREDARQLSGVLGVEAERAPSSVEGLLSVVWPQIQAFVDRYQAVSR